MSSQLDYWREMNAKNAEVASRQAHDIQNAQHDKQTQDSHVHYKASQNCGLASILFAIEALVHRTECARHVIQLILIHLTLGAFKVKTNTSNLLLKYRLHAIEYRVTSTYILQSMGVRDILRAKAVEGHCVIIAH